MPTSAGGLVSEVPTHPLFPITAGASLVSIIIVPCSEFHFILHASSIPKMVLVTYLGPYTVSCIHTYIDKHTYISMYACISIFIKYVHLSRSEAPPVRGLQGLTADFFGAGCYHKILQS